MVASVLSSGKLLTITLVPEIVMFESRSRVSPFLMSETSLFQVILPVLFESDSESTEVRSTWSKLRMVNLLDLGKAHPTEFTVLLSEVFRHLSMVFTTPSLSVSVLEVGSALTVTVTVSVEVSLPSDTVRVKM